MAAGLVDAAAELHERFPDDAALQQYILKAESTWDMVKDRRKGEADRPMFLFMDGPLTVAAKASRPLVLEDFDQPSQAVMERMNSLIEPVPVFSITEDITNHDINGSNSGEVVLSKGFQVFATVHRASLTSRLKISPATRSRFTEIAAPEYVLLMSHGECTW